MAFKVKEIDGSFYVGKGKSYYPDTKSANQQDAERQAMLWEMQDLYNRSRELFDKGVERGYFDDGCFGDYMC